MDKKKYIVIGAAAVIVLLFVAFYFTKDREEVDILPEEDVITQERKEELESMKDKDFYEDPVLTNLGKTEIEIVEKYGEPDETHPAPYYYAGKTLYYEDINTAFVFTGEEGVVNNIFLYPGAETLGIQVGMTFDEIEGVLGEPEFRGLDEMSGQYLLTYFLGEEEDGQGELELWIDAKEEDGPTNRIDVLWKKYWKSV